MNRTTTNAIPTKPSSLGATANHARSTALSKNTNKAKMNIDKDIINTFFLTSS